VKTLTEKVEGRDIWFGPPAGSRSFC